MLIMKNNVHIEIDTRTFVRFWLVVIGFLLAALAIYSARTALIIIGISFFLAIALNSPVNRLAKMLPSKSRVLGTTLAYVAVILFLGAIVFLVIPPIIEQTAKFVQNIPSLVDSATKQSGGINEFIHHYNIQPEVDKALNSIKDSTSQFVSGAGMFLITSIGSVLSVMTSTILVLVLTFFMLVECPMWMNRLWSIYNDKDRMDSHKHLLKHMYSAVTSYVTGQLSVSSIAGLVAGIVVFVLSLIFGVPTNLAIPALAIIFMLSLIPMFGEIIGVLIVSAILALNSITAALIFLVFFVIYAQVESNYISPKIQSKRTNLSALAILASVTIGIYLFGLAGGIISIPIAGCIKVLLEEYFTKSKDNYLKKQLVKTN